MALVALNWESSLRSSRLARLPSGPPTCAQKHAIGLLARQVFATTEHEQELEESLDWSTELKKSYRCVETL